MRTGRGRGKTAPSSPSVDALAAIAARKAAKIEKSLNKIPAMQLIADQLARENALKVARRIEAKAATVEALTPVEAAGMGMDADYEDGSVASVEVDASVSTQVHKTAKKENAAPPEFQQPSSTQATDEDVNMVDADFLADFDLESGSEKDFFMEQLRIAPSEEVDMLLSSLKHTKQPTTTPCAPIPASKTDEARQSLLELEVANFAHKRAAVMPKGVLTKEQLDNFKEEVYMYGIGLSLSETQALLAAAKAETNVMKSRSMKTTEGQLALPQPPIEASKKSNEHSINIQNAVNQMVKDVPQSWAQPKAATGNTSTANKRKRTRPSKGGPEAVEGSSSAASAAEAAFKRQKISPLGAVQATCLSTTGPVIAEDAPKLTRKQKQELYRQGLEDKRPVIASKIVPATASPAPTSTKPVDTTAVVLTSAPSQPAQKTRQRARKSAAQRQIEKAAKPIAEEPAPIIASTGPKAPGDKTDGFVDQRAPKKKRRGRKSAGTSQTVTENDWVPEATSISPTVPEVGVLMADKPAPTPSDSVSNLICVQNGSGEGEKDKNKSKRQNKINKRKFLGNEPLPAAVVTRTAVETPSKPPQAAAQADKPAAMKQTPVPPPSRAILPRKGSPSIKAAPAKTATTATSILSSSSTPILPPSSVSKLVLKSPAVATTDVPILPSSTPKAASSTPLAGISAPNSSSKGRKRGPRKSDVAVVANANEPKENHS